MGRASVVCLAPSAHMTEDKNGQPFWCSLPSRQDGSKTVGNTVSEINKPIVEQLDAQNAKKEKQEEEGQGAGTLH